MSGTNSPEAVKKLLENMQSDLRALSLECKKKFPPVKEHDASGSLCVMHPGFVVSSHLCLHQPEWHLYQSIFHHADRKTLSSTELR
ncbi:hypothetical protein STEG23_004815 [Scotinomys teguina]